MPLGLQVQKLIYLSAMLKSDSLGSELFLPVIFCLVLPTCLALPAFVAEASYVLEGTRDCPGVSSVLF
jgi:hypothetical protein